MINRQEQKALEVNMAIRKLTPALLRKIVLEEKQRIIREKAEMGFLEEPVEVEADEYADTLESHEDHTVKEAKARLRQIELMENDEKLLLRKLKQLREAKNRAIRRLKK